MLTQLIQLLGQKVDGLSLSEISREMQAQPSAVLAMIEQLVQKGRLLEIGPDGNCCTTCGLQSDCTLLFLHTKRYMLRYGLKGTRFGNPGNVLDGSAGDPSAFEFTNDKE